MTEIDYTNLNLTELAELAKQHGYFSAHRGLERHILVKMIKEQHKKGDYAPDPADDDRDAMIMMKEEWPTIYDQLKCASEHYACWVCPSVRARACAVEECDPHIRELITKNMKSYDEEL